MSALQMMQDIQKCWEQKTQDTMENTLLRTRIYNRLCELTSNGAEMTSNKIKLANTALKYIHALLQVEQGECLRKLCVLLSNLSLATGIQYRISYDYIS